MTPGDPVGAGGSDVVFAAIFLTADILVTVSYGA
jgi:hypothetical protein